VQRENDFIYNPFGHGWHIDRGRFDRMLADVALERGALVELGASVKGEREGRLWRFRSSSGQSYECDFVVDATGRAPLPFGPHRPRKVQDRLVALAAFGAAAPTADAQTVLEAAELGWWYAARLPGDRIVATLMTDPSLVRRDFGRFFFEQMQRTLLVAPRFLEPHSLRVSAFRCTTTLRTPVVQDGWIAVGDAASAYDPLSSQGICKALDGAPRAVAALTSGRLEDYETWVRSSFEAHVAMRAAFYAEERRWEGSPFWRGRQLSSESSIT
jgi:flavin-dependent dehydrogenase